MLMLSIFLKGLQIDKCFPPPYSLFPRIPRGIQEEMSKERFNYMLQQMFRIPGKYHPCKEMPKVPFLNFDKLQLQKMHLPRPPHFHFRYLSLPCAQCMRACAQMYLPDQVSL